MCRGVLYGSSNDSGWDLGQLECEHACQRGALLVRKVQHCCCAVFTNFHNRPLCCICLGLCSSSREGSIRSSLLLGWMRLKSRGTAFAMLAQPGRCARVHTLAMRLICSWSNAAGSGEQCFLCVGNCGGFMWAMNRDHVVVHAFLLHHRQFMPCRPKLSRLFFFFSREHACICLRQAELRQRPHTL